MSYVKYDYVIVDPEHEEQVDHFRLEQRAMYAMSDDPGDIDRYLQALVAHIGFVREAGRGLGVPSWNLAIHDQSKFSPYEFQYAANHFEGNDARPDAYIGAWLHHMHHNPHHWQHWIFPDNFSPEGTSVENGVVEMPSTYALEMVADWMGSSMAYTSSWNMADWLKNNRGRIRLHSRTAVYVDQILTGLGYGAIVRSTPWAQETS